MREIKFRAWDKIEERLWYTGFSISCTGGIARGNAISVDDINDRLEVMEFTGLKDKNGKEIYEGDIVNAIAEEEFSDHTTIGDIISNENYDFGEWQVRQNKQYSHGLGLSWGAWESIEVIGNIYENPELLK
jgi:uncharacterized phage protein (TIGR01671 family)